MANEKSNDDDPKPFRVEPDYFEEYDDGDYGFDFDLGESEVY
jgi:hypothetical protein